MDEIFADRVSEEGNRIGCVRPSALKFHVLTFEPLDL